MATQLASATDQLWDRWPYLSHEQRLKQFRELHTGEKADFFLALNGHDQYNLLLGLPEDQRHVWMRLLAPDDAADVIQQASPEERENLLALLDEPTRKEVVALLAYKEDEAGGLMNPRFARLRPDSTVDVSGNLQAKCYALVGIHRLDPKRFRELMRLLRDSKETVTTLTGCILSREAFGDVIKQIESGRFS
jgi:MgtE intracellular N domain